MSYLASIDTEPLSAVSDSEALWAEHGLTGLVLFSLLSIIVMFVRFNQTKSYEHNNFVEKLLEESMDERREIRNDNAKNVDKLSAAIDSLTDSIKNTTRIEVQKPARRSDEIDSKNGGEGRCCG
jgi:uncharacterized protein YlxW (UPF0749 family)